MTSPQHYHMNRCDRNESLRQLIVLYQQRKNAQLEQYMLNNIIFNVEKYPFLVTLESKSGGDEACMFNDKLFALYKTYCKIHNWTIKNVKYHKKNFLNRKIEFIVSGDLAYKYWQFEYGVHCVKRIPLTDKKSRVHTSTCSVIIQSFIDAKKTHKINKTDVIYNIKKASGPGGQHRNKTESAVEALHVPTGCRAIAKSSRSQLVNRESVIRLLQQRVDAFYNSKNTNIFLNTIKSKINNSTRTDKIRSYNFQTNKCIDHRIKHHKKFVNITQLFKGVNDLNVFNKQLYKNTINNYLQQLK